jgi:uncharacterized protein
MNIIHRTIFPRLSEALGDNRAIVITGMRRVGKTTTLRWLLDQVNSANKIFLDLERGDIRAVFREPNYEIVLGYLRSQGLDPSRPMTVALDEIQYEPNLPSVVKYLSDTYSIKFLLTGSSSFYLKNYFSESLAGRKAIFEMFPLGFGEFLDFQGIACRRRIDFAEMVFDPHEFERLKKFYEEFLQFGGLPSVVLESRPEVKRDILADIYSSYINIDVRAIADFRKIGELQQLLKALANRIGNKLDPVKLSQIVGISRPTLNTYLDFLEMTYLIARVPAYSGIDKTLTLGKKLYFLDNGIAGILANPGGGALFENAVFNQLRGYGSMSYYSKRNEGEIDFILNRTEGMRAGLEVKLTPLENDLRKVARFAQKLDLRESWIVGKEPTPGFLNFVWGGLVF